MQVCLEQKTETKERVKCSNPGCEAKVRQNTTYQINNKPYCADCYIFLTEIR